MSDLFDLDTDGQRALDEEAALNPLDLTKPVAWGAWSGSGEALKGLVRPSAAAGRAVMMLGAPIAMGVDAGRNVYRRAAGEKPGSEAQDWYFRNVVDDLGSDAVDYWTATPESMGAASRAVNVLGTVAGSVPQMIGAAPVFLAGASDVSTDLVRQGVDSNTALGVGAINLGANAVGMRIPAAWGNTLTSRLLTGAGSNLAVGVAADAGSAGLLEAGGYDRQAAGFDPANVEARGLDLLMGLAFGIKAHVDAPVIPKSERDAVLTATNVDHFQRETLPGEPLTDTAAGQHQDALAAALAALDRGERVNVAEAVKLEDFLLPPERRPELAGQRVSNADKFVQPGDYDRMLVALESSGDANARPVNPDGTLASGAYGLHQFTPGTWRATVAKARPAWAEGLTPAQLLEARSDPVKSAEMERVLRGENAAALTNAGETPTAFNLYAAHHFGATKGVAFARAADDTPMAKILTAGQLKANPYLKDLTKAETIAHWTERARKAGVEVADGPAFDPEDLPNFGLPEAPRTIAADDPFWQTIPVGKDGPETNLIDTPERQALRSQLVAEHFANIEPRTLEAGEKPVAYLMGGGGASGKGTILADLKARGDVPAHGAVEIDPDAIKAGIPEYGAILGRGDSRAAAVVHEESSAIAKRVLADAIASKFDIVLDRTLGDKAKGLAEIQALKDAGYEVRLYGVTVDPKEAVKRAVKRAKRSGRYVPLNRLLQAHKGFADAFEDYANLADHAVLFDNTGPQHLVMAESRAGAGLAIGESVSYNSFRGRRFINDTATTLREIQGAEAQADRAGAAELAPADDARGNGAGAPGARRAGNAPDAAGARPGQQALDPEAFPAQGETTNVVTERGLRLPVRYAVVDVSTLVTSHDDGLAVNPAFPAELQPRDRARAASEQQIAKIANNLNPELLAESPKAADGAPIVGQDKVVESGNARTIAVRRAYSGGKADAYRTFLVEQAERFGLDPAAVDGIAQPMLVRVALAEYDRAEFARQANESTVAAMSVTEQAQGDAARIPDLAGLVANDDGTINMRASGQFVRDFLTSAVSPNEQGAMMGPDGSLSQQGVTRIRNAVFAKAYGDVDLVGMMAESTDANVKNILAGMLRAAPAVAKLREQIAEGGRYPMDITPDLVAAVRKFSQLRSEGTTVEQFLAQGDFFGGGVTGRAKDLLVTVGEHARAPKRMAEFLQRWTDQVHALGDPRQGDLMGGQGTDADSVVAKASADTEAANTAPRPVGDLFGVGRRPAAAEPVEPAPPAITPENRAAHEAIASMPDLMVADADGNMVPAAEFLAAAELEHTDAATAARTIDTAINCFLRTAA